VESVRSVVLSLLAAALAAGLAGPAAAAKKKKHYYYSHPHERHIYRQPVYDVRYKRFGSRDWWDQMVREDRARR
jgi:hypothetical protein